MGSKDPKPWACDGDTIVRGKMPHRAEGWPLTSADDRIKLTAPESLPVLSRCGNH